MGRNTSAKKMRSIAWSISASHWGGLFSTFILVDIIVILLRMGDFGTVWEQLAGLERGELRAYAEGLLQIVQSFVPLYIVEGVVLFFQLMFGAGKIRRKLRPLDELASAAVQLGQVQFDETRFHELEDAIDHISPTAEGSRLSTGDTELAGLEQAVNKLLSRMRDSYRQQARFVSDASHELRTPIAVIQGYANMLDRWGKEDEKILAESIDAIKSESDHMKRLVEQLLFLARGDSGRTPLNMERFDLSAMMREVYEESVMIDPTHAYELRAEPGTMAWGDVAMLKQTARILIENAAKYTAEGEQIRLKTADLAGGGVSFTVQDAGVGMSAADVPHVFERFFRADTSRTRETGGTGLGLAIAKWIVDKHGGRFDILSREGLGTRISVVLPPVRENAKE